MQVIGPVAFPHVADFEFLVREDPRQFMDFPVRRVGRDKNQFIRLVLREIERQELMFDQKLDCCFRQGANDLARIGHEQAADVSFARLDGAESVVLRHMLSQLIGRYAEFLLEHFQERTLVTLILAFPFCRLDSLVFGDDLVSDKVFDERCKHGTRGAV